MIITTSEKIDGYVIDKYLGLVCGTDIYLVGGVFGGGLASQEQLFGSALRTATNHMEEKAKSMGADAVIAVQQSFTSPGGINSMIIVLTGTAVKLKEVKEDEYEDTLPPL